MNGEINYLMIGARLLQERQLYNLTREEMAEKINISPYFLGQLERGERKMSITTLIKISRCLRISIDYLIFGHGDKSTCETSQATKDLGTLIDRLNPSEQRILRDILQLVLPHLHRQ